VKKKTIMKKSLKWYGKNGGRGTLSPWGVDSHLIRATSSIKTTSEFKHQLEYKKDRGSSISRQTLTILFGVKREIKKTTTRGGLCEGPGRGKTQQNAVLVHRHAGTLLKEKKKKKGEHDKPRILL